MCIYVHAFTVLYYIEGWKGCGWSLKAKRHCGCAPCITISLGKSWKRCGPLLTPICIHYLHRSLSLSLSLYIFSSWTRRGSSFMAYGTSYPPTWSTPSYSNYPPTPSDSLLFYLYHIHPRVPSLTEAQRDNGELHALFLLQPFTKHSHRDFQSQKF